ncbi:single-stranded DNA-binding protein [Jeotgalibacillus soli]|uniref:Single-stranded DNA-binding protein n=1 Tax=Jeotgalibacillus soli TaxID=889306 RepID=A0A0C2VLJ6_9BACL|nr:single-stranded DNA-binding protein [Jeotgalibacillus soli]KIL49792.1 single-stranded DNA-binding protein [Jeotgalibacillus soli]
MINQVTLVGRLTRDPELKTIGNGKSVLSIVLAVNRPFKNQQGDNDADFVLCTIWNRIAENTSQYCHKGSLVGVTGRIQTRFFDKEDGNRQYVTEVLAESVRFLESKRPDFTPASEREPLHMETL